MTTWYKHVFEIELITQFPHKQQAFEEEVQQCLGPWAKKVTAIKLNEKIELEK